MLNLQLSMQAKYYFKVNSFHNILSNHRLDHQLSVKLLENIFNKGHMVYFWIINQYLFLEFYFFQEYLNTITINLFIDLHIWIYG
jgi:hypothetical protein